MNEYLPIILIAAFMGMLFVLLVKAFLIANKFIFIKIGKLAPPYRMSWGEIKKNSSFYLGTDLQGRIKAAKVTPELFVKDQNNKVLTKIAKSFRSSLVYAGISILILIAGIALADGQMPFLIFSTVAATAVVVWGIARS